MSKLPWKTVLAVTAVLAATAYAFAQMSSGGPMGMHGQMQQGGMMGQMHSQMMQGQGGHMGQGMHGGMGMQGGMGGHGGMHGQQSGALGVPTMPGQDAFGTIQEIVQILQSDPKTDRSKVNIDALRQHLIDMNEVTLHAAAAQRMIDNGIEITVTGEGRTLEAIKRMVPAHVNELHEIGWSAKSEDLPNGVKLTVLANEAQPLTKLKALGFMGIMVQGGHHQPHHLMMAMGQFGMH
jgi:ribosomal protein L15